MLLDRLFGLSILRVVLFWVGSVYGYVCFYVFGCVFMCYSMGFAGWYARVYLGLCCGYLLIWFRLLLFGCCGVVLLCGVRLGLTGFLFR